MFWSILVLIYLTFMDCGWQGQTLDHIPAGSRFAQMGKLVKADADPIHSYVRANAAHVQSAFRDLAMLFWAVSPSAPFNSVSQTGFVGNRDPIRLTPSSTVARDAFTMSVGNAATAVLHQQHIKKVALLQDQQIPQENVVTMLEESGFDVVWSFDEPSDAEAIVTVTAPVTKTVLDKHPNCKLVAVSFTGFNQVDLDTCKERGIAVVNVPAYSTDSVAELAIGLTLSVYREIPMAERTIRVGDWVYSKGGSEIKDKVVGIVGLGDIGLRTAELFRAFKPKEILGWSRQEKIAFSASPISGKQVSLEELFDRCDIVSVHVALNAETQGFIGRSLLERLRPESVLINVARGGVLDQDALAELLSKRRFRAGLDVFVDEPILSDDPILKVPADQVVLVPHVAYKTVEALKRRMAITAENIRAFSDGSSQNRVA